MIVTTRGLTVFSGSPRVFVVYSDGRLDRAGQAVNKGDCSTWTVEKIATKGGGRSSAAQ